MTGSRGDVVTVSGSLVNGHSPNMPPPAERRKSSKQLLEEKQIKRFLRAKKRSRNRGAKQREEDLGGDNTVNGRELEDSPLLRAELESKENALEENIISSDESDGKRWMEYKITKVVSIERSITYVKVPKEFLVSRE